MSLAASPEYEEPISEINANFAVIDSTLNALRSELAKGEFFTSYVFISENIKSVVSYIQNELEAILGKIKAFRDIWISSPLQISAYKGNPVAIFEYRDTIRDFSESTREMVANLYANVKKTLAAYIVVYETLENLGSNLLLF